MQVPWGCAWMHALPHMSVILHTCSMLSFLIYLGDLSMSQHEETLFSRLRLYGILLESVKSVNSP